MSGQTSSSPAGMREEIVARSREVACWEDVVYVTRSLERPEAPVLRAFRIAQDAVTEVALG